jgi:protein-S-isoprenylcysteine O-methyltransferase Ste14
LFPPSRLPTNSFTRIVRRSNLPFSFAAPAIEVNARRLDARRFTKYASPTCYFCSLRNCVPLKPFAGTKAEFKFRVWIFALLFCLAFLCYAVDKENTAQYVATWLTLKFPHFDDVTWARIIFTAASALVFFAAAVRTWGTSYLHAFVMNDSKLHTERLVADGPFRHVRNPLYFGNILLGFGMGIAMSRPGFFVLVIGMFIFNYRLILREESELSETQGESYREYCAAVPRLFPSLTPRVPSAGNIPNWLDGFLGELMFWGFGISIAVLAVTLSGVMFESVLWISFMLPWLIQILRRKSASSASNSTK